MSDMAKKKKVINMEKKIQCMTDPFSQVIIALQPILQIQFQMLGILGFNSLKHGIPYTFTVFSLLSQTLQLMMAQPNRLKHFEKVILIINNRFQPEQFSRRPDRERVFDRKNQTPLTNWCLLGISSFMGEKSASLLLKEQRNSDTLNTVQKQVLRS